MWRFLAGINRNLVIAIPITMLLGFGYGLFFPVSFLKMLIIPFTFLMVYPMMVTLKLRKVFEGGDVKAQLLTQAINFGVIPFAAFWLGLLFFREAPYMALVYGSVMRNLSIALAIAINAFGPQGSSAALVVAIAYVIQVQSAAWYVRLTDKLFGPAEVPPPPAEDRQPAALAAQRSQ